MRYSPAAAGFFFALLTALYGIGGCASTEAQKTTATEPAPPPKAAPSQPDAAPAPEQKRNLRLILTTDEHGWLLPLDDKERGLRLGGVVETFADLQTKQRLNQSNVLLLSSGDNWTGPFESTVLEGAPMVKAFNRMGYAASAVGNHEFDFGTKTLQKRANEANFPFLAANVREAASGQAPAWAKAFTVVDTGTLKVGLIGLTFADAHAVTDAKNLVGLEFLPYEDALKATVPKVKAAGAEFLVVLLHDRMTEAQRLLPLLRELGISVVAAGHVHTPGLVIDDQVTPSVYDDVAICNAGAFLRSYCVVNVQLTGAKMTTLQAKIFRVETPIDATVEGADSELQAIVESAQKNADKVGGEVLAKSTKAIRRKDQALGQLVVDSWLSALPYADVAITNRGGLRQDLKAGRVRVRDVRSVLPFNNTLVVIEMTGEQLREVLKNPEGIASGVRFSYQTSADGERVIRTLQRPDGTPIGDEERLKVVVNDFMYRGGDHFSLRAIDREPEETALDWREPLVRMLRGLTAEKKKLVYNADDRALEVNQ